MSYQDRYKGRKIKDPPSYLGRFGLFILVGAAFAAFVGTLRGQDSNLCALATLCMVACKLLVELIATKAKFQLPERFAKLPLAVWLLFWLLPIPPLWFVLRTIWPKNVDPSGAIGFLTIVCFVLYIPTILAVIKPPNTDANQSNIDSNVEESGADKIDFNVDFNAPDPDRSTAGSANAANSSGSTKPTTAETPSKSSKLFPKTNKLKKKGKK